VADRSDTVGRTTRAVDPTRHSAPRHHYDATMTIGHQPEDAADLALLSESVLGQVAQGPGSRIGPESFVCPMRLSRSRADTDSSRRAPG
jgi:hypothetical protein